MEKDLVSVVVPVFNAEKFLNRCVNSIIKQTYKQIEIILVNDGSTDGSLNLCNEFAKTEKRVKVYNKQNEGVDFARNDGIKISTGEFITFVDSDDYLEPTIIEKLVGAIKTEKADLALCKFKKVYEDHEIFYNEFNLINCKADFLLNNYTNSNFKLKNNVMNTDNIMGCVWRGLYKKEHLKDIKFEGGFCEDLLFNINYLKPEYNIVVVNEYLYNYYQHPQSALHSVDIKKFKNKIETYKKIINALENKLNKNHFISFKFYIYKALYVEALNLGEMGVSVLKEDKTILSFNSKENYKAFNKKTKSLKSKISNYLIFKDNKKLITAIQNVLSGGGQ